MLFIDAVISEGVMIRTSGTIPLLYIFVRISTYLRFQKIYF